MRYLKEEYPDSIMAIYALLDDLESAVVSAVEGYSDSNFREMGGRDAAVIVRSAVIDRASPCVSLSRWV